MKAVTKTCLVTAFVMVGALGGSRIEADGISGSGYVKNSISRFDGVVLDGVRYDTSRAIVRINGEPADERDLKIGQLVLVRGDVDSAEAEYVDYYDTLRGPVQDVVVHDAGLRRSTLTVMKQRVSTNNETWFHGGELADIVAGTDVAVSGHRDVDGTVIATAVVIGEGGEQIVSGRVSQAFMQGLIFRIGEVMVSATMAATPDEPIEVGTEVFVRGEYRYGVLVAARVEVIEIDPQTDAPVLLEGVLESVGDGWQIDGRPLELSEGLRIDKSAGNGSLATVEGSIGSDGVVRAVDVQVESVDTSRIDGHVRWFDADKRTLTVDGVELHIGDDVMIKDDRDGNRGFSPAHLVTDDAVSVTVQERGGRFHVRSLARKTAVTAVQRMRVQTVTESGDIRALGRSVRELANAESIRIDGKSASSHQLRRVLRRGHDLRMTWNESGEVETVDVFTEAGGLSRGMRR